MSSKPKVPEELNRTVELVVRFEEEFGIEIPDEDAEKIRTVSDAYSYVERAKQ